MTLRPFFFQFESVQYRNNQRVTFYELTLSPSVADAIVAITDDKELLEFSDDVATEALGIMAEAQELNLFLESWGQRWIDDTELTELKFVPAL